MLRVDLLLPAHTQGWLLERLGMSKDPVFAATRINGLLHDLMRDKKAVMLLEQLAGITLKPLGPKPKP